MIAAFALLTAIAAAIAYSAIKIRQDLAQARIGLAALGTLGLFGVIWIFCLFGYALVSGAGS